MNDDHYDGFCHSNRQKQDGFTPKKANLEHHPESYNGGIYIAANGYHLRASIKIHESVKYLFNIIENKY